MNNRHIKFHLRHAWEKKQGYKNDLLLKDMFAVKYVGLFFSREKIHYPIVRNRKKHYSKFRYYHKYTLGINFFWVKLWLSIK